MANITVFFHEHNYVSGKCQVEIQKREARDCVSLVLFLLDLNQGPSD